MYSIGYPVGYHGPGGACDALIPSLAFRHVIARRNKYLGSRPIFSISCGVSVKQFAQDGKRAKSRSALPASQRADSEVQVQLEVVCTAEACRGETRWMGLLGGRTMMMYMCVSVVGLGDRSRLWLARHDCKLSASHGQDRRGARC
jgi:hypothetical protein